MIRLYTYAGYVEINGQRLLKEPYLARAVVKPGESSKPEAAPRGTALALLISDGPCTYELNIENAATPRTADKDSLKLDGHHVVAFGTGWTVSVWTPECDVKAEPAFDDRMSLSAKIAAAKPGEAIETTAGELAALAKGGIE